MASGSSAEEQDNFVLEADNTVPDNYTDTDSALGDDMSIASSTASLMSSIMRMREENGRLYDGYKGGRYLLPSDEPEMERQEFQYGVCLFTFDQKLSFAPVKAPSRVLDVGCGRGFWCLDYADHHPESQVIGVDLVPNQPAFVPSNVQFEIDDLEEPWAFSFKFDYIHSMMMTGAFRDWPNFYRQAFENLNPNGWLEIQDMEFPLRSDDSTLLEGSALKRWSDLMVAAGERSGFKLTTCGKAAEMMSMAGFVDIVRIPFKWPINPWPRDEKYKFVGWYTETNFTLGLETMMLALFTRFMGWTRDQVQALAADVRAELHDRSRHAYFNLYVTYGRKL